MNLPMFLAALWSLACIFSVSGAPTDTLMDGDSAQSGYLPNNNVDPNVITGGSFGQIWQFKASIPQGGLQDNFYAKPLVYTPSSLGRQVVLVFSEANRIYVLDAVNGTLISSRDLSLEGESPFLVSDLPSCNDIGQNVGITGTPVIDPTTDTVYFWAKGYLTSGQTGWQNGAYRFHAVDVATLVERPGFPTNLQGAIADNDNTRWFTGGTHLQRASLNMINGIIFAGFGAHCDLFNYTGWVVGMSTSGKYLTGYVTMGGPGAPLEDGTYSGGGGGAGVWMSGSALSSDNSGRLFFATGNAESPGINQQVPSSGRVHLDTLSESMVNLAINPQSGSLTQQDYFEPATYLSMDAGDRDLGSGGVCLPDSSVFSGGGVARLAITCGKAGVCFVTNADNLGGYKMGSSGGDAVVQSFTVPGGGAIFSTVGTYPLEGGYLYVTPVGNPTYVYSLGFDTLGRPAFTLVAQTNESSASAVGATITTLNNQPGTGILWITDTNGLRAYNAVPVNGQMLRINIPAVLGLFKFSRPTFGDGRYYMPTFSGSILAFGAPVALPLNCSSPIDFGTVSIGSTSTMIATCTANIAITKIEGLEIEKPIFQAQNSSLPQGSLGVGQSFSFPITFNLTNFVVSGGSTDGPSAAPGVESTALNLFTVNSASGYSTQQGITLTGTAVSQGPYLAIDPLQVNFPGIVVGSAGSGGATTSTFLLQNLGKSTLTITGYAFGNQDGSPYTNVTMSGTAALDSNGTFTSQDLPSLGSTIAPGGSITVTATFNTSIVGSSFTILTIFSDGGSAYTILSGTTSTAPIALLEQSTSEGGWLTIPDCAIPADGCTNQIDIGTLSSSGSLLQTIRFTNNGGSNLEITKSKPPEGTVLGATNPSTDLSEGLIIPPGAKSSATIYFQPGSAPLNSDPIVYSGAWTLNTNDLTFGVHVLNFTGTLTPPRVGPLLSNGSAQFKYLGCFQDPTASRIEPNQFSSANNTNGLCQQQAFGSNFPFAGTEYQTECWVGYNIPPSSLQVADSECTTYTCPGDTTQFCGGYGGFMSLYYDTTKYNPGTGSFIGNYAPPSAPPRVGSYQYAGCYTDNAGDRTLNGGNVGNAETNSLENCAAACKGSTFFGTEYSAECYCGNSLLNSPTLQPNSQCTMLCPGNTSEICGAASRLTLYILNGTIQSTSSITASTTSSLPVSNSTVSSSSVSLIPTGTIQSTSSSIAASTTSSLPVSNSTVSPSSVSPIPTGPIIPPTIGNYQYVDCHSDNITIRTLQGGFVGLAAMTIENCASICTGFTYFGLEYSTECYCGNTLTFGSFTTTDGRCTMPCGGNSSELCGGANGLTLYQLKAQTISSNLSTSTISSGPVNITDDIFCAAYICFNNPFWNTFVSIRNKLLGAE
ncbi:hypothetical protein G7Y89_g13381 [Cudoniella acicularis]|uniref:WSC domain-containing protein n=1 Tax=Cudoniella acicularis TaxID=354080 RepID=A0A8H4R9R1_9HELO|nr:hypothetical protein G7Y89_g13381 [Cudoniella acicularis]